MKANRLGIKAILLTVVCALIIGIGASPANAVGKQQHVVVAKADFHFIVDGKVYHAPKETQGFLYNNRTYVPIRFASYLLEKWVVWDQKTSTVSVTVPSDDQLKQLQSYKKQYLMPNVDTSKPASAYKKENIYALVDAAGYNFFGKEQSIPKDVTTFLHKGTLYVPLRYFAELIQHDISYDSATKSIIMNSRGGSDTGNNGNNSNNGNNGGSTTNPDNGTGGTTAPGSGNGGTTNPGTPGEVDKPTRAELVSAAKAQLSRMETRLTTLAFSLYEKYEAATTAEEKQKYIDEGFALMGQTDADVQAVIDQLNKDLAKYDYEIGNDGAEFLETYKAKKEAALAKFL